jgi:signal transduction histidine kinase
MSENTARDVAAIAQIDAVPIILDVVCRVTGMGFAAIARVTEDRWVACSVRDLINFGLEPGGELQVETTICNEIRQSGTEVVIDHVAEDMAFRHHPTPAMYGFQSYISVPIRRPDGVFFGTLCAIDPRPARVTAPEVTGMFRLFADLIGAQLDTQDRLVSGAAALADAHHTAELRDQFIAVLGHDLRSPLAAIGSGMNMLSRAALDARSQDIVGRVQKSVARMDKLIDNVLDFARGRLGGGIPAERTWSAELAETLREVVAEVRMARPNRDITAEISLDGPVFCDQARIGQLLSNLLTNALVHGDPAMAVDVVASLEGEEVVLSVGNGGKPIPETVRRHLFQPFQRTVRDNKSPGLGLGLFIASEIARAHGGRIDVESTAQRTSFTLRMPIRRAAPEAV